MSLVASRIVTCSECGARNLPDARQCVVCGATISTPSEDGFDSLLGTTIGDKYRVDELIGKGSMGRVYAGYQLDLNLPIGIKVLHPHVAADPRVRKRFHREAQTASRLTSPYAMRVFDFGRSKDGTLLYLIMELLDGPNLLELLDEEAPLSPERIVLLLSQVLEALVEAHQLGIVHRDLKAENILIVRDANGRETAKVCDFGIAKLVETEGSAITMSGFVCGTPEYMSPEQARGEEVDGRADIYAAGCLLYQCLTGEVPFAGSPAIATITRHISEPVVPPPSRRPEWKPSLALSAVALRALAKQREMRFSTAQEMIDALQRSLHASNTRSRTRLWYVALLGSLVFLGGVAAYVTQPPTDRDAKPETVGEAERPRKPLPASRNRAATPSGNEPSHGTVSASQTPRRDLTARGQLPARSHPDHTHDTPVPPVDVGSDTSTSVRFEQARTLFRDGNLHGATTLFEEILAADPSFAPAHKELGRAYMRQGRAEAARLAYVRYLELSPSAPDRAMIEAIINP